MLKLKFAAARGEEEEEEEEELEEVKLILDDLVMVFER